VFLEHYTLGTYEYTDLSGLGYLLVGLISPMALVVAVLLCTPAVSFRLQLVGFLGGLLVATLGVNSATQFVRELLVDTHIWWIYGTLALACGIPLLAAHGKLPKGWTHPGSLSVAGLLLGLIWGQTFFSGIDLLFLGPPALTVGVVVALLAYRPDGQRTRLLPFVYRAALLGGTAGLGTLAGEDSWLRSGEWMVACSLIVVAVVTVGSLLWVGLRFLDRRQVFS